MYTLKINCYFEVFNADCRIVHFIFHLKSKIPFDKMDLIDETGRLVGLHQLEESKPFDRLMHFIKTNVSIGHVMRIWTISLSQSDWWPPLVCDSQIVNPCLWKDLCFSNYTFQRFHILVVQRQNEWSVFSATPPHLAAKVANRIRDLEIISELLISFQLGEFVIKDRPKLPERPPSAKSVTKKTRKKYRRESTFSHRTNKIPIMLSSRKQSCIPAICT